MIAVAGIRHYGWAIAPPELRGLLSKALGAMALMALVWVIEYLVPHWAVKLASLVWTFEQMQIVVCSAWFAVEPWPLKVGQPMCSAKAGIDLGAFGVMLLAFALWRIVSAYPASVGSDSSNKK